MPQPSASGLYGVAIIPARPKFFRPVALFFFALLALTSRALAAEGDPITPEERSRGFRQRTLLAKPRANLSDVERAEAAEHLQLVRRHTRLGGLRTLATDGREDVKAVIQRLTATGLYEYVEPDYIRTFHATPNDPRFAADQWALDNTGQSGGTTGADIRAAAAWEIQREAPDVIVAVMDTGLLVTHEDIARNVWVNLGEQSGRPNVDDDADGFVDDINGINATVPRSSLVSGNPYDEDGHGTHVAGIIGAVGDNDKGVTGVAWKTQIMPLKFIGRYGGSVSDAVTCIDYAIAKRVHIINGSYGSTSYSQAEFDALKRARDAGIIFVAAAGNDSQEINTLPEYPAAYPLDNIIAVASTTRQDALASYSTFGSGLVELAAPGSAILSLGIATNSSYVTMSGTSMAAPHVAGALALLKQKFPDDNYRALINRLLNSVDRLPSLQNRVQTNGRLNLQRALTTTATDTRPFNDDFARRAVITGELNYTRSSNQFATTEPSEPNHGVPGSTGSLWWSWTAPEGTGKASISMASGGIDAVLAVYTTPANTTPTLANLQRVASNAGTVMTSNVTFEATAGTTYTIAIAGKAGTEGLIAFSVASLPNNDAFAQARLLTGPSVVVIGNNAFATAEPNEPLVRNARGTVLGTGHTLWYKWVAPATRNYQVSSFADMDSLVSIYTGNSLTTLTEVAFDDDSGPFLDSLVRFNATAGVTYYIRVDSSRGAGGSFTLSIADAAWQFSTEYPLYATPAAAADGTLYAIDYIGYLHAVNPDGTRKWRSIAVDGYVDGGAIAVGSDGTLYIGDDYGELYAVNPANGAKKWSFATDGYIWAAPALAADGTIYVKSDDGRLYALNPDGTKKWQANVPGDTYSSPAIATDGTIYIAAGDDSALYALNPDGSLKWRAALGATIYASPAIGSDGTLYIGNYDGRFFALRPDGTERWHFDTKSPLSGSAVVDARGLVYFGSYDNRLYALDAATGAKRWDYNTGSIIRSTTPLLADDGTIYIGSDDGFIHALNADGTLRRTYATAGPIHASPILTAGRLYVGSTDAKLYAFDTGNNLARGPWPMHRHNLRRLARATDLPGIPTISTHPAAPATVQAGSEVTLTAAATLAGTGTITYQWFFNDVPLAGATSATLQFPSAQGSNTGTYRVVATGPGGAVVSNSTTLTVAAAASDTARLINLAVRTTAGSGDRVLFLGFAIGGAGTSGTKPLLIRGIGPALGAFGVTGALADPKVQIYSGTTLIQENDDWGGNPEVATISPRVGAFELTAATGKDAALITNRTLGSYTAQISGAGTTPGIVLAEIYDATPAEGFTATTPRLTNVSALTQVGTGSNILIAGFVVGGNGTQKVLVRGIGPTLTRFGVTGVLGDPKLELYRAGTTAAIATNDNWGASSNAKDIETAAASVAAFSLPLESKDAVLLLSLPPGTYTAQISGVNNTTGAAIVEVYEVP